MALSQRGTHSHEFRSEMLQFAARYQANPYDKDTNPGGIINLGLAESQLCEDLWIKKMNEPEISRYEGWMQYYTEWRGLPCFRAAIAEFLTERLHSPIKLNADNIVCTTGAGAALELLAHVFADPGDTILTLTPVYSVIASDFGVRSQVKLHHVHLPGRSCPGEKAFTFTKKMLEEGLKEARNKGENVKAMILMNPGNPTGDVYDINLVKDTLQFCHENDLHIIMDEVYALSVWEERTEGENVGQGSFRSVLSLTDIPDPQKTHFVWSFSKDFGLSGFHCGVIHTFNKQFVEAVKSICYFTTIPHPTQIQLTKLLQDKDWLSEVYFPTNLRRMRETAEYVRAWCGRLGINAHPGTRAAYFIWADLSMYLQSETAAAEQALCEELFTEGVYIVPGTAMFSREAGWFRITFTMKRELLNTGLERIEAVLKRHRKSI